MWASRFDPKLAKLEVCPYDKSHKIPPNKFMNHVVKCRRQYRAREILSGHRPLLYNCQYNQRHQVLAPEVSFHERRCEDRKRVYRYQLNLEPLREHLGTSEHNWLQYDSKPFQPNSDDWEAMYGGLDVGMVSGTGSFGELVSMETLRSTNKAADEERDNGLQKKYSPLLKKLLQEQEVTKCAFSKDEPQGASGWQKKTTEDDDSDEDWGKGRGGPGFNYMKNIWKRPKSHTTIPTCLTKAERVLYLRKHGKQMEEDFKKRIDEQNARYPSHFQKEMEQWQLAFDDPLPGVEGEGDADDSQPGFRDEDFEFY